MYGYIYKVTCIHPDPRYNGKIYCGQHARGRFDPKYKGSGTLIRGLRYKLGEQWFKVELIERCKDQQELDAREEYWIAYYHSRDPMIGYNQSYGGRDNDAKLTHRNDFEAQELREMVYEKDPKVKRDRKLKDPNNWIVIYKDGRAREVFIDKLQFYLDKGWKTEQ